MYYFMKKFLSIFAMAMVALAAMANEVTLFDGTVQSECVPVRASYYDWDDYKVQVIYPADQLTALQGSTISSLKFYIANEDGNVMSGGKVAVSIGTTEQNAFASYSPTFYAGELTKVAEISMTHGDTELVINFDQPWFYAGGNIILETLLIETGQYSGYGYFFGVSAGYNSAYGASYATAEQFIPKTTFTYEPQEDYALVTPLALDFGQVQQGDEVTKTITITNLGTNAFTPVIGTLVAPYSVEANAVQLANGESMTVNVKFVADEIGQYPATLTIDCGAAGNYEIAINAETIAPVYEVVAADGTNTEGKLPFYGTYYDEVGTYGQMIYTEEMMGAVKGNKITKVTFHSRDNLLFNGGKVQLSFKVVEETAFEAATPITDMTVVATLVPVPGGNELTFVLDEPYQYNGGNLAIEANVIESSTWKSTSFYGVNQDYYASLYHYSSTTDRSRFLPKATFTFSKDEAPVEEWQLGDVNHDHSVDVNDVTMMISYILGTNPTPFYEAQANVDGDAEGAIDVNDVTSTINIILTAN